MMPVPWLFRMVESSACPPPLPCLSGLAEGRAWSLQWAAICPKPLSSKPVVRACDEGQGISRPREWGWQVPGNLEIC